MRLGKRVLGNHGYCGVLTIFACGSLILPATPARADNDYFDLSTEQLLKAQVFSASKKSETLSTTPAAVFVITQEDIRRSGATSIPELLRMAPGVNVARADSNTWAISIRGFQQTLANKILVMIDGRTVYNPFFAGTFWEVQDVPLEDIERIEIIRGPGGALWGANAVDGVINILTKNAKDTQGNLAVAGAGNYERGFGEVRHGGSMPDGGFYRAYAKYTNRGAFQKIDGEDANDSWDDYRTGFRMDWGDKDSADHFVVHGDAYRNNTDDLNPSFSLTAPFETINAETTESRGANILGLWRHNYADGASVRLQSYLDQSSRHQELYEDNRDIFDTELQYNFRPLGRNEIATGASYRLTIDDISGSDLIAFDPASRSDSLFSAFAQDKITLQPNRWFLTLGSKFEHNDYTGFEFQPNARLAWTPDDRQTVWASVSRAVRTPSRIERDLDITNLIAPPSAATGGFPAELILAKNKDFDSEDLVAYELGYRKQLTPTISADATTFINDYAHLASATTPPFPFFTFVPAGVDPAHVFLPVQYANDMRGKVYGFELSSTWNVNPSWKLSAGYTFLNMDLHAPLVLGATQDGPEGQSPQNQFNLRSYWNINDRWTLDTLAYYVDQLPQDNVGGYVRLDMNVGWKIQDGVQFNLVGQNLLDDAHREFGSASDINTSEVTRSVFGKLTLEF